MSNRLTIIIAIGLLLFMFLMAVFSIKEDSATMDEMVHLPAGYSYLTQKDMRLNPEHPPLLKDLSAVPLLFIENINFPSEIKDWREDVNGQWGFGHHFLYGVGNPADKMIFWGRIPIILILILLGFYVFKWTRQLFGNRAGLLALFLFSFSPTFLAHGRLVTTDVAAAAGIFLGTGYFLKTLQTPNKKNIILAGLTFGVAQLCKFSAILLVPFFAFLALAWILVKLGTVQKTLKILILVFIIGLILIGAVYQYHVWNYPIQRQTRDIEFILSSFPSRPIAELITWMSQKSILRPFSQYALGLAMVLNHVVDGHTAYFLGEVSASGWWNYFPVIYSIKEPLAFHILTLFSLIIAAILIKKPFWQNPVLRIKGWIKNYFPQFSILVFIAFYWGICLNSTLNIGVRHLLPAFPFTMVLTAGVVSKYFLTSPLLKLKYLILGVLILWQALSVISIYPHFLAYFNQLAGGPDQGYIYTVNSNLDWGQDLKRLKKWVEENNINKIYVDYFGGGDPQYYLKEKYLPWQGTALPEDFPKGNYLAVSATFLQGGRGRPAPGFDQPHNYYNWLYQYQPIAKIGYSIFIYYIP